MNYSLSQPMECYTVREYGHICCVENDVIPTGADNQLNQRFVPKALFEALEVEIAIDESVDTRKVIYRAGSITINGCTVRRLLVQNHVGVLATSEGVVEILPKIAGKENRDLESIQQLRAITRHMLETVDEISFRQLPEAPQDAEHDNLFEWFIGAFLQRVLQVVKRGLRSAYESVEDNLPVLRGRLQMAQHLRLNVANQSRLYVRFDEFTPNRPENRVIHTALRKCRQVSRDQNNRRLVSELLLSFVDVDVSRQVDNDLRAWRPDRGASHYTGLDNWCRAILKPVTPSYTDDSQKWFDSFLFPADILFERYVAERVRLALVGKNIGINPINVEAQVKEKALFNRAEGPFNQKYPLRPDIVIKCGDKTLICDTKWKFYEDDNDKTSSADIYQMYVYAHYWKNNKAKQDSNDKSISLAIIAPTAKRLNQISGPHCFNDGGGNINLWMLPFDFSSNGTSATGFFNQERIDSNKVTNDSLIATMLSEYQAVWSAKK